MSHVMKGAAKEEENQRMLKSENGYILKLPLKIYNLCNAQSPFVQTMSM
jgi:hypothetical protein